MIELIIQILRWAGVLITGLISIGILLGVILIIRIVYEVATGKWDE